MTDERLERKVKRAIGFADHAVDCKQCLTVGLGALQAGVSRHESSLWMCSVGRALVAADEADQPTETRRGS